MNQLSNIIVLNADDNVAVARDRLDEGTPLDGVAGAVRQLIEPGHKVAIRSIASGEPIRKYNQTIGFALKPIAVGEHVHVHNVGLHDFEREVSIGSAVRPTRLVPANERATFMGYRRSAGGVGTRNYIGVLTSVNCSASVARFIADAFRRPGRLDPFPHVDGVVALTHTTGCGMQINGEGHQILQRVLGGYARHPNFAGILLVGLGCEVNQVGALIKTMRLDDVQLRAMTIQQTGGTRRAVEAGIAHVTELLSLANEARRVEVDASHLTVGLQCGGSDGYSGIGANPALGVASDLLVRNGGTAILSETPEIYGAEHLLLSRATNREVGERLLDRIRWWKEYTAREGAEMDNNPAPGNKAGGLTTILEKALGSAAKGGTTNLVAVYRYAEPITEHGFVFMDSPGYDPASATGQIASGANIICFTTGRGSVFGCKPVPSLKIATNTPMYERMVDDMDINAGTIIDGTLTLSDVGEEIFRKVLAVASGERTKSEELGFGDEEFVPWQIGAVM